MPGCPVITAYYQVSVRPCLVLPSASFMQHFTVIHLPRLMERFKTPHRGLSPPSFTPFPAHITKKPLKKLLLLSYWVLATKTWDKACVSVKVISSVTHWKIVIFNSYTDAKDPIFISICIKINLLIRYVYINLYWILWANIILNFQLRHKCYYLKQITL